MKELFDALNGLAQKAKTSMQSPDGPLGRDGLGGLAAMIGDLVGNVTGRTASGQGGPVGSAGNARSAGTFGGEKGGLLGSAALGGVLGALLASPKAREMAAAAGKSALAAGGGAAAAAMAWGLYKKWSGASQPSSAASSPASRTEGESAAAGDGGDEQERHARLLMEAMVFAARSDGQVDDEEKANIRTLLASLDLGPEVAGQLEALMHVPVDPAALAARVRTPEEARDIYRLSCLAVRMDQFMERNYLDALAHSLHLSPQDKTRLEQEAADMRRKASGA